jgi:predicted MPP superfamily phosphohydrolase
MQRIGSFALFFFIALAVMAGFHYYLWVRLVRDPGWPAPWGRILAYTIISLGVTIPVGLLIARSLPLEIAAWLVIPPYTWLGFAFLLGVALIASDVLALLFRGVLAATGRASEPPDPARRALIARAVAGGAGVAATAVGAVGMKSALGEVDVREVEVRLERLPRTLSGLTVIQFSDVHVGPTIGRRFIEHIVERANAAKPDIVAITGDLVDGSVEKLISQLAPLADLRPRFGVYFVTGNHEYYSGVDQWLPALAKLGVRVLRNERLTLGDRGGSIDIAGVDDASAHRFGSGHGADYERALSGSDPERELILLAHQPRQILPAVAAGAVGLQLSGHTHGGQIWPFGHVVGLVEPYVAGLHQHDPRTQIYVSRGTGYWGPPLRVGAPAEITKLVLV